jgi:hypothetical protein
MFEKTLDHRVPVKEQVMVGNGWRFNLFGSMREQG